MKASLDGPVVPSYVAKIARAKKHLAELKCEITAYVELRPYTVGQLIDRKGKPKPWHVEMTADPANTDIPVVAADVIYNLRSSLDHLMASLVAPKRRSSVMFPVFWEGVWEADIPGENEQRSKDRSRWRSCVQGLPSEAVAILKSLQPPNRSREVTADFLATVNALSNKDRHQKLPVAALGLRQLTANWTNPDGTLMQGRGDIAANEIIHDKAEIDLVPNRAVDVEIQGVAAVALKIGQKDGAVEIPDFLDGALLLIEKRIIPTLSPYTFVA